jgi:hypothetical protein
MNYVICDNPIHRPDKMKNILFCLLTFLSLASISCNKEIATENPGEKSTFRVTELLPLSDKIPYESPGRGKLLFERTYAQGGSSFYVINIDNRKSSGFIVENSQMTQPVFDPTGKKQALFML